VSLRIAFDLDGTLADLHSALDRVAASLAPPETGAASAQASDSDAVAPEEVQLEPPDVRALSPRRQREIWNAVRATENFWETLDELEPGIVERIAALALVRGWEVIFLTQRPSCDGDITQRQTQRWLKQKGFDLPSVYVLGPSASRGKVAAALGLDAVVDDRPENCLDVKTDSEARAFLVARNGGTDLPVNARRLGIEAVSSVAECLDTLEAAAAAKPGLLGRLRRALGAAGQGRPS